MKKPCLLTILLFSGSIILNAQAVTSSACHDNNLSVNGCYGPFNGMTAKGTTTTFNQPANSGTVPMEISDVSITNSSSGKPVIAHFLPWFRVTDTTATSFPVLNSSTGYYNNPYGHVEVGYDSSNAQIINRQLLDISSRGFSGVMIDWYGPYDSSGTPRFEDTVTRNLHSAALNSTYCQTGISCNLKMAIMEDQGAWLGQYMGVNGYLAVGPCQTYSNNANGDDTTCIANYIKNDLSYVQTNYVSPGGYLWTNANTITTASGSSPVYQFFVDENETVGTQTPSWPTSTN